MSFVLDLKNTVPARILCFLPRGLQMYLTRLRLPSFIRLLADGYLPAAVWSSNLASIAAKYSQAPLSMYPSSSRLKNLPEQAISIRKAWDVDRESMRRATRIKYICRDKPLLRLNMPTAHCKCLSISVPW